MLRQARSLARSLETSLTSTHCVARWAGACQEASRSLSGPESSSETSSPAARDRRLTDREGSVSSLRFAEESLGATADEEARASSGAAGILATGSHALSHGTAGQPWAGSNKLSGVLHRQQRHYARRYRLPRQRSSDSGPASPLVSENLAARSVSPHSGQWAEPNSIDIAEKGQAIQPIEGPATTAEVAEIVRHPALIVTRNVEWGTVILGFEQANRYTVLDQDGNTVALLAEDSGSFGKEVGRQVLRTRRSFTATILSPEGHVILRLRRPMYLINSTIHVEDGAGNALGEVRQRFHVWQRNYDIFLGRRQIAAINSPLLAWEFALRDEKGGVLALIDRNFQGFGKELFTDAGKYVIHFGDSPQEAAKQIANTVQAAHPDKPRPSVTALAKARTEVAVIPTSMGDQLQVARPLDVDERTLVLAAAVSIDFDYFSQHSQGSGLMPWMMLPQVPYPAGGDGGSAPGDGPETAGAPPDPEATGQRSAPEPDSGLGSSGQGTGDFGVDEDWSTQEQGYQSDFDGSGENAGWFPEGEGGDDGGDGGGSTLDFLRGIFGDDQ